MTDWNIGNGKPPPSRNELIKQANGADGYFKLSFLKQHFFILVADPQNEHLVFAISPVDNRMYHVCWNDSNWELYKPTERIEQ